MTVRREAEAGEMETDRGSFNKVYEPEVSLSVSGNEATLEERILLCGSSSEAATQYGVD
jgi:hypothetical protein